jgi:hypothetical protein
MIAAGCFKAGAMGAVRLREDRTTFLAQHEHPRRSLGGSESNRLQ